MFTNLQARLGFKAMIMTLKPRNFFVLLFLGVFAACAPLDDDTSSQLATPNLAIDTSLGKITASKITVLRQKVANAAGYTIMYSTDESFPKAKTETKEVAKDAPVSKELTGLTDKKKYYIKIMAKGSGKLYEQFLFCCEDGHHRHQDPTDNNQQAGNGANPKNYGTKGFLDGSL